MNYAYLNCVLASPVEFHMSLVTSFLF